MIANTLNNYYKIKNVKLNKKVPHVSRNNATIKLNNVNKRYKK
jgi:hypothetical protein